MNNQPTLNWIQFTQHVEEIARQYESKSIAIRLAVEKMAECRKWS